MSWFMWCQSYQIMVFDWLDTAVIFRTSRGVALTSPATHFDSELPFACLTPHDNFKHIIKFRPRTKRHCIKQIAKDNPGEVDFNSVKLSELCVSSLQVVQQPSKCCNHNLKITIKQKTIPVGVSGKGSNAFPISYLYPLNLFWCLCFYIITYCFRYFIVCLQGL